MGGCRPLEYPLTTTQIGRGAAGAFLTVGDDTRPRAPAEGNRGGSAGCSDSRHCSVLGRASGMRSQLDTIGVTRELETEEEHSMRKGHIGLFVILSLASSFFGGAAAVFLLNGRAVSAQSRPPSQPVFDIVTTHSLNVVDYRGDLRASVDASGDSGRARITLIGKGGVNLALLETHGNEAEKEGGDYATFQVLEGGTRCFITLDPSTKQGPSIKMEEIRGRHRGKIWSAP